MFYSKSKHGQNIMNAKNNKTRWHVPSNHKRAWCVYALLQYNVSHSFGYTFSDLRFSFCRRFVNFYRTVCVQGHCKWEKQRGRAKVIHLNDIRTQNVHMSYWMCYATMISGCIYYVHKLMKVKPMTPMVYEKRLAFLNQ